MKTIWLRMLGWLGFVLACSTSQAQSNDQAAQSEYKKWVQAVHDQLPSHLLQKVDQGRVTFTADDAMLRAANKTAITIFQFETEYRLQFQVQGVDRLGKQYRITLSFKDTKYEMRHTVVLPSDFLTRSRIKNRLLEHEFDHVAITTDPRIERSLPKVMWFTETWIETLAADEVFSQELIGKKCEAKVQKRKNAFEKLLSGQYERLDQASSNGLQDIRDRREFFDSLYRLETLKELQYPYLSRLESSLGSKKFQDTANHYLLTP